MRDRGRGEPDGGLRRHFHQRLERVHLQAMELGVMGSGCPDTNGCADGTEFWIEYKHTASEGVVPLEPQQIGWILRRMRAGGRVFVATWVEHDGGARRGEAVSRLHMHEGWDAPVLRSDGVLAAPPVLVQDGRPQDWDWGEIRDTLVCWTIGRRSLAGQGGEA